MLVKYIIHYKFLLTMVLLLNCNTQNKTETHNANTEIEHVEQHYSENKKTNIQQPVEPKKSPKLLQELAHGHKEIRRILGTDIGQMNFDSQAANTFRAFMANSLLTSKSNSANSGYGSSDYSESNAKIQFCANGTFVQALSGYVSIDVEGMSASSGNDTDYMPGYWEVASLPNNMLIILFYSTHPTMLEDSPNGFLPFPVSKYTASFVAMPNGDGYARIVNQYCN